LAADEDVVAGVAEEDVGDDEHAVGAEVVVDVEVEEDEEAVVESDSAARPRK